MQSGPVNEAICRGDDGYLFRLLRLSCGFVFAYFEGVLICIILFCTCGVFSRMTKQMRAFASSLWVWRFEVGQFEQILGDLHSNRDVMKCKIKRII